MANRSATDDTIAKFMQATLQAGWKEPTYAENGIMIFHPPHPAKPIQFNPKVTNRDRGIRQLTRELAVNGIDVNKVLEGPPPKKTDDGGGYILDKGTPPPLADDDTVRQLLEMLGLTRLSGEQRFAIAMRNAGQAGVETPGPVDMYLMCEAMSVFLANHLSCGKRDDSAVDQALDDLIAEHTTSLRELEERHKAETQELHREIAQLKKTEGAELHQVRQELEKRNKTIVDCVNAFAEVPGWQLTAKLGELLGVKA